MASEREIDAAADAIWGVLCPGVRKTKLDGPAYKDAARAALIAAEQSRPQVEGQWKLVPVEPSEAMIDAAMNAGVHINVLPRGWTVAYQAMLAASPPPPASQVTVGEITNLIVKHIWVSENSDIGYFGASDAARAILSRFTKGA